MVCGHWFDIAKYRQMVEGTAPSFSEAGARTSTSHLRDRDVEVTQTSATFIARSLISRACVIALLLRDEFHGLANRPDISMIRFAMMELLRTFSAHALLLRGRWIVGKRRESRADPHRKAAALKSLRHSIFCDGHIFTF